MKKYLLCIIFVIYNVGGIFAQNMITVTFKPGAAIGCDAVIFTSYGALIMTETQPRENITYGDNIGLGLSTWTMDGNKVASRACSIKSFIKIYRIIYYFPQCQSYKCGIKIIWSA